MIISKAGCGMLFAVKRSSNAVGYCSLSIRCGTREEDGFPVGTAHFTEHAIFRGTTKKSSSTINSYLDKLGGNLDAYTTKEEIVLHATVLKEDLMKASSLLFELATGPRFPEKEIETERGVILDEIKSYKDSPSDDIYDTFEELLFKGHPLSRAILGTEDSVKSITSDDLRRFVTKMFLPGNMAFSACADIDEKILEKKVRKLIDKFFPADKVYEGSLAGKRPEGPGYFVPPINIFNKTIEKGNHEANAVIGALGPSLYEDKERYTAVLLGNILAGPFSNSILNDILREKNGWVYSVETSYTQYSDTGIFTICLGCDRENIQKCCRAVDKEILKLQTIPLSERKLKAAKKQLLGQAAISSDNEQSKCLSMSESLLEFGTILPQEAFREKLESLTSEDVMEMAKRIFRAESISRLIYL